MKKEITKEPYKYSQNLYIVEAAVEYFIAILIGSTYLAKMTTSIGMSDGLTGVITSFVSLGFGFQIFALLLVGKSRVKRFCTLMHLINQLAFSFLYIVPIIDIPSNAKTVIFVLLLLTGVIIQNVIFAPKLTWLMGLVDAKKRGIFTAKKEMVSLLLGVVISLTMGRIIDNYEARGELKTAFLLCGITMIVLTLVHTFNLIAIKEKGKTEKYHPPVLKMLKGSVMNKSLWKLVPMFALWQIATYITTPFYGTYQLNEGDLGFSMTFVAVLSLVYAVARSVFSIPIGKFADKYSFVNSLTLSYGLMVIAYGANIFFGKPFYIIYGVLQAIAMAGINSGTVNLIYDFVPHEHRTGTLAIKNTLVGFIGFFSTIAVTPLFNKIQGDGNKFLFVEGVRAQQVLSFFALLLVIAVLIYLNTVVRAMRRQKLQIEKATIYGSDHIEIKEKAKNESHR
jgi:hypothetical protein